MAHSSWDTLYMFPLMCILVSREESSILWELIHLSMAIQPIVGPRPVFQLRNLLMQTVGLFGRGISPSQVRYLNVGQHKHRINAQTDIHVLSGIRTYDPSVQASGDSSCLRPRGHCDRLF
jgi:hypothetical protein